MKGKRRTEKQIIEDALEPFDSFAPIIVVSIEFEKFLDLVFRKENFSD